MPRAVCPVTCEAYVTSLSYCNFLYSYEQSIVIARSLVMKLIKMSLTTIKNPCA